MAVDNKYDALIAGLSGGGDASTSSVGGSFMDSGNDLGRGPGTPGSGRSPGAASIGPSNIGARDQYGNLVGTTGGYTEADVQNILRGMPPERIADIQQKMKMIGLLPENFKSFGFVENTTRSGFAELLEASNMRDSNYMTTLDVLSTAGPGSMDEVRKDAARKRAQAMLSFDTRLNVYDKSDPASVRQTAEAAFAQALGRKPKKDELEKFTAAFLGRERGSQEAVFDVQDQLARGQRDRTLAGIDMEEQAATGGAAASGGSEADVLWDRLQKMVADSPYKIGLGSRSRSYEEQVRLWNNYKAGKGPLAAKPGTSKHGDGRANDLKYSSPAARKWVLENAHKYGLHLPLYDPKKPRSKDESWHVEVLGGAGAGHSVGDGHNHAAMTAAAAPVSQDVTNQRQDVGAQAIEFARKQNPVETAAYDIGGQFTNLLGILQKGVI